MKPPLPRSVAVRLDADSVTVYMTRAAIERLAHKLMAMARSDPRECHEVHIGLDFSEFDADDQRHAPHVSFGDGLGPILDGIRQAGLQADIAAGEVEPDVSLAPFEVTLMHVSQEAVDEESQRPDEKGPARERRRVVVTCQ